MARASGPLADLTGRESVGYRIQRRVPIRFHESLIRGGGAFRAFEFLPQRGLHQWCRQPVGMVQELPAESSLDAEHALVGRGVPGGGDFDHFPVVHVQVEVAAHAAVGARRGDLRRLPVASLAVAVLFGQGARGTNGDALPAEDAVAVLHAGVKGSGHLGAESAIHHGEGVDRLDLVAGANAAAAADALLHVPQDEGIALIGGEQVAFADKRRLLDSVLVDQILELAMAAHLAGHAVVGVVGEKQLQDELAGGAHLGRIGLDLHPLGDGEGAGGLQYPHPFDLNQAETTGPLRGQCRMVTECGDADAVRPGYIEDGPSGGFYLLSVDGESGH